MSMTLRDSYSDLVLDKLRKDLVLKDGVIFNTDFDGAPTSGAVKVYVDDDEATVGDYNPASGIQAEGITNSYLTIPINKDKAVNVIIDGYEAAAVSPDIVAERLDSAAYSLALQLDTDGAAELVTGGTAQNITTLSKDNIYGEVVKLRTKLSKLNVPKQGRYLLVTPDTYALLLNSPEFISASNLGDEVKQTGAVGAIAGFNIYEWNDSTANLAMIAGHPRYATRAYAWRVPVQLVDLNGDAAYVGASAVKGRLVYGHKDLRASCILPVFSPTVIATTGTALTGGDAGKYTVTASATDSGTLKYKVITDGVLTPYGADDTGFSSFTSGTTKITASSGNIIEIGEFKSDELIAAGYYVVA